MDRKRILITGGAGFLGSHLCDRFIKENFHVIAMDNLITGSIKNIEHLFRLENFEFYNCDVSKFVYVPGELDYILHFASPASPIDYLKIPIQTLKVGSLGTHNLLGLAKAKKARILVEGIYRLLMSDYAYPVNIGNPDEITIKEFAEEIIRLTGTKQKIVYKILPKDDPKQRKPDIARAKEILKWQPKVTRAEGLKVT